MKKNTLLFISLLFFYTCVLAQKNEKPNYFPLEQIIHPDVPEGENPEAFLNNLIKKDLKAFISEKIKDHQFEKDTITPYINFSVKENGEINERIAVNIRIKDLDYKITDSFKTKIQALPKFTVLNWKKEPYPASHIFIYSFIIDRVADEISVKSIENKDEYIGGATHENPLPEMCKNLSTSSETKKCFNKFIRNHVQNNFKYPKEAREIGIEGTVYVRFKINKKGKIEDIKGYRVSPILIEAAEKIFKNLPKIKPGLLNGEPKITTFMIPVKFALI